MNPEEIWNMYSTKLKHYIMSKVSDPYEAEDILQEVGLRILKNENKLGDITSIEAWLYRITKNLMMDHFRRAKKVTMLEELDTTTVPCMQEHENYNKETADCLLKLVDYLSPTYKEAIIESDYKGKKQNALGEKWGLSYSGSKNRVQRARKKLKSTLLSCCEVKSDKFGNIIEFANKGNASSDFSCMKC